MATAPTRNRLVGIDPLVHPPLRMPDRRTSGMADATEYRDMQSMSPPSLLNLTLRQRQFALPEQDLTGHSDDLTGPSCTTESSLFAL